jgi:oligosaccharide repeat unit polymerase
MVTSVPILDTNDIICSVLFLGYALFDSLKGQRTLFLVTLITILYFYSKIYKKKFSMKSVFWLILIVIVFSIFMENFRFNRKTNKININDLVVTFLYGQGISIVVPAIIIEDGDNLKFHNYPFIFSQLLRPYFNMVYPVTGQSETRLKKYNLINDITTYRWAPRNYYVGYGLGGSFLGEMYDCGGVLGIIFWSWILALLMRIIEANLYRNTICVIVFWWIVSSIVWLPRSRFFDYFPRINSIIAMIIITAVITFFIKYNKDRRGRLDANREI